jgi:hypothetical protein
MSVPGAVERITGPTVLGFVSGIDTKNDISTETFCLEPASERVRLTALWNPSLAGRISLSEPTSGLTGLLASRRE